MAQVMSKTRDGMTAEIAAFVNAAATTNLLLELDVTGLEHLSVEVKPTVRTLDAFVVDAKFHPKGDWVTITNAITSTPAGLILAASGTLASLAAAAIGWFIMDVRGLVGVRVSVSGTVDDTGLVTAYAHAA